MIGKSAASVYLNIHEKKIQLYATVVTPCRAAYDSRRNRYSRESGKLLLFTAPGQRRFPLSLE
jgi:hypothetical protein